MSITVQGMAPLLQVFDMPRSIAFYRDVLGFEVISTNRADELWDWVLLRLGDAEVMLNTAFEAHARPRAPDPARIAAHDDVCIYFGCPDVHAAYAHLRARGVDVKEPTVAPYGMKQLTLADPDGYALCFQWPVG